MITMTGRYYYYPPSDDLATAIAHAKQHYQSVNGKPPDIVFVHPDRYQPLEGVEVCDQIHATGIIWLCEKEDKHGKMPDL
jgi:hypothetical protein